MGVRFGLITEFIGSLAASYKLAITTGTLTRTLRLDTLADWIIKTYASFTQSGSGAVSTKVQDELRTTIRPEQFGAIGDGATDDATAWINMIAAHTSGYIKCDANKNYYITKSIFIGDFSSSGNGQSSFSWGANGTKFWGGTVASIHDDLTIDLNGSTITFNGTTSLPMFVVIGSTRITFKNGKLNGAAGATRASEGIWFASGVCWQNRVENMEIVNCKRGRRYGDNNLQTEDPVTFTNYWPAAVTTSNGWSIEYNDGDNVFAADCDIALSIQSAQIIHFTDRTGSYDSDNAAGYCIYLKAGRIKLINPVFGGTPAWAIYCPSTVGVVHCSIDQGHIETSNNNLLTKEKYGTTEGGTYIPFFSIRDFDAGDITLGGAFSLVATNCRFGDVYADTNTNTDDDAIGYISLRDCTIYGVVGSTGTGDIKTVFEATNTRFLGEGSITTPFSGSFVGHLVNKLSGCHFDGPSFTADVLSLNSIQEQGGTNIRLANNGSTQIAPRTAIGFAVVASSTPAVGLFAFYTDSNAAVEVSDPAAVFTITKDNAGTTNVYMDGVARGLYLQNKSGGALVYRVQMLGSALAIA